MTETSKTTEPIGYDKFFRLSAIEKSEVSIRNPLRAFRMAFKAGVSFG